MAYSGTLVENFAVDRKLPFGARSFPTIFHRISQTIKIMMIRRGYEGIVAYQDDFIVTATTYEECVNTWVIEIELLLHLGLEINYVKLVAPTISLTFLAYKLTVSP